MKMLLKISALFFALSLLTFIACKKENTVESTLSPNVPNSVTAASEAQNLNTPQTQMEAVYLHNGTVLHFEDLNLDDDNTEVFAGFTINQNELLVFFSDNEVKEWLLTLPENVRLPIENERLFNKRARAIAIETNVIAYFNETGKVSDEYQVKIDSLRKKSWTKSPDEARGGIGYIYSNPDFSGQTLPLLGLGIGYPLLFQLDKNINSAMTISVTAQHGFHTKRFFFGARLLVNGWFQFATVNGGPPIAVGGAAGPFTVQLVGVLSSWGSFGPKGNIVRSYNTAF